MAVSYYTKTITFSTNVNKTGEIIITNIRNISRYPLKIYSATNCIVKENDSVVSPPCVLWSGSCTVYPNNNNWEVVCYNEDAGSG